MEKKLVRNYTEWCGQYWTSPGGSNPQSSSCTATNHPSRKLSKLDEANILDTTEEVEKYSCGPLSYGRVKAGRSARTYINSSVPIQDVALMTYRNGWTIEKGGGRGSVKSMLMVWHNDDEDNFSSSILDPLIINSVSLLFFDCIVSFSVFSAFFFISCCLCFMAYQPLLVIWYLIHPCRITVILSNRYLGGLEVHIFSNAINPKVNK